jgi:hypothetical protein
MPDIVANLPDLSCFHLHSEEELKNFNRLRLIHLGLARATRARTLVREPPANLRGGLSTAGNLGV